MSNVSKATLVLSTAYLSLALTPAIAKRPTDDQLSSAVREASGPVKQIITSAAELVMAEQLFEKTILLAGAPQASDATLELKDAWEAVHMEFTERPDPSGCSPGIWIVREPADQRCGRGLYAFRCAGDFIPVALQMPHCFNDRHTRIIGASCFEQWPITAAAWNTVHREAIDVAHSRLHYFNAFTAAISSCRPDLTVLQLHGFAKEKRTLPSAQTADCILSNGSKIPSRNLVAARHALEEQVPQFKFRLFPNETRELGGTKNHQARLISDSSGARFVHLEMSRNLRDTLRQDSDLQNEFFKPLLESCRN